MGPEVEYYSIPVQVGGWEQQTSSTSRGCHSWRNHSVTGNDNKQLSYTAVRGDTLAVAKGRGEDADATYSASAFQGSLDIALEAGAVVSKLPTRSRLEIRELTRYIASYSWQLLISRGVPSLLTTSGQSPSARRPTATRQRWEIHHSP
jgi:hypothetical protein